jgi:hypothetical protein
LAVSEAEVPEAEEPAAAGKRGIMVPEEMIDEFVRRVREAANSNLESVILYGSAAGGDFDPEFSNINMFCVLRDTSFVSLRGLESLVKWWEGKKQPAPLLMTRGEFRCSADVFPIEFMDMKQHHRILFGDDVVSAIEISREHHRMQVEYELREKLILLRQHVALAARDEKRLRDLMLRSLPSITTLFRHAVIATGGSAEVNRREAVQVVAEKVGFDPAAIELAIDVREHKNESSKLDVSNLLGSYLSAVEKVIAAVDQAVC